CKRELSFLSQFLYKTASSYFPSLLRVSRRVLYNTPVDCAIESATPTVDKRTGLVLELSCKCVDRAGRLAAFWDHWTLLVACHRGAVLSLLAGDCFPFSKASS